MSLFPKDTAQTIAESIGLSLSDEVASSLVQDAEYRLRDIIHVPTTTLYINPNNYGIKEATKFMKHSKRTRLTPQDVNLALRIRNVEPLYGYDGYNSNHPFEFKMAASGNTILYYANDKELDLEEIISSELPLVPLDVTMSAHWLSIEGVQPRIIQNPTPADLTDREQRLLSIGVSTEKQSLKEHGSLVKTVLTQELQLYYTKITESLSSPEEEIRKTAIDSIAQDPGIQGLLPYFVEFISDTISKNIKNLSLIWTMMRLIRSILYNPDLFVEPYLHHLVPNILTCLVAKRLSESPSAATFEVRQYAGQLISHICFTFGDAYPTLIPRITKTLLRAFLDPSKSLGCRYGALEGLGGLGPQVIRTVVVPNIKVFLEEMKVIMDDATSSSFAKQDAQMCIQSMEKVVQGLLGYEYESRLKKGDEATSQILSFIHKELGPSLGLLERRAFSDFEMSLSMQKKDRMDLS